MAELGGPVGALSGEAVLEQLADPVLGREASHQRQWEPLSRDRGHLRRLASLWRERAGPDQDRVADRLGHGQPLGAVELQACIPRLERAGDAERVAHLLHEEGDPLGALVDRPSKLRAGRAAEPDCREPARLLEVERLQDDLFERSLPAQLGAGPSQRMGAGELVRAIDPDHEHGHLRERPGEIDEEIERRVVGPLEVVEDDDRATRRRQRSAYRFEQRLLVAFGRGASELGQKQGEMRLQRPGRVQAPRRDPQV